MLELQADYFAGVWAHHAEQKKHILEEGDIEAGLNAASRIGDDALQKQAQGYAVPDSFTHGIFGPAREVVPQGAGLRRHGRWQHLRGPKPLITERETGRARPPAEAGPG